MLKILNALLVLALLVVATMHYSLAHKTQLAERDLERMQKDIRQERENIKLLKVEWSHLARPERLEKVARTHFRLAPVRPEQIVAPQDLARRLPERPPDPPHATRSDPIAQMLKVLQ